MSPIRDTTNTRYNRRTTMEIQRYTAADLPSLFDKITKNSIGYDFDSFWNTTQTSYPPYNLIHISNEESRLELHLLASSKMTSKSIRSMERYMSKAAKRNQKMMERMSIKDWHNVPSNEHGRSPTIRRLDPSSLMMDSSPLHWEK